MKKIFLILAVLAFQIGFSQEKSSIRIVESKKIELKGELDNDKINLYNKSFLKFIDALKTSDKQTIHTLISDKAKDFVDDNMIRILSGGISFDRKTEIYKSGNQKILGGESYPAIQYKYADDKSNPPRDLITVIFENDGKILGVNPSYTE